MALVNDVVVGRYRAVHHRGDGMVEIRDLAVDAASPPTVRRALIVGALEASADAGAERVVVLLSAARTAELAWYGDLGFETVRQHVCWAVPRAAAPPPVI